MINFTTLFLPILAGLLAVVALYWAVEFWQIERSLKVFCFFIVFSGFCFLYLVSIRHWSMPFRTGGQIVVLLALVGAIWDGFNDVFTFMREKKAKSVAAAPLVVKPEPAHSTLHDLADAGEPMSLIATPTPTTAKEEK